MFSEFNIKKMLIYSVELEELKMWWWETGLSKVYILTFVWEDRLPCKLYVNKNDLLYMLGPQQVWRDHLINKQKGPLGS